MHIYVYTYIHTYIYIYAYVYVYINVNTNIYIYIDGHNDMPQGGLQKSNAIVAEHGGRGNGWGVWERQKIGFVWEEREKWRAKVMPNVMASIESGVR